MIAWKVGCFLPPFFRAAYISKIEAAAGASEGVIPSEEVPCHPYDLVSHSPWPLTLHIKYPGVCIMCGVSDCNSESHFHFRGSPRRLRAKTVHVLGVGTVLLGTRVCLAAEAPVAKKTLEMRKSLGPAVVTLFSLT